MCAKLDTDAGMVYRNDLENKLKSPRYCAQAKDTSDHLNIFLTITPHYLFFLFLELRSQEVTDHKLNVCSLTYNLVKVKSCNQSKFLKTNLSKKKRIAKNMNFV